MSPGRERTFHAIEIADPAYPAHIAHGDGEIDGPVPGMDGYVFDEDCTPVLDEPMAGCYENDIDTKQDLLHSGPVDTANNIQSSNSNDGNCGFPDGPTGLALVLAVDAGRAGAACGHLGGSLSLGGVSLFGFGYSGLPPNAWLCTGTF